MRGKLLICGLAIFGLTGCGGDGSNTLPGTPLSAGVFSGTWTNRAIGDRLDLDLAVSGGSVTGFARLRKGSLDFLKSEQVSGTTGTIVVTFSGQGTLTLQRDGSTSRYFVTRVVNGVSDSGRIYFDRIPTPNLSGNWQGTWQDGSDLTALNLTFTPARNYFQITGTATKPGANGNGRVSRGFGTIVGDRIEFQIDIDYPLLKSTLRAEGQVVNNSFTVGTDLRLFKRN